jgi:hypothetical protein
MHLPFGDDIIAKKKSFLQIKDNLRTDQNPAIDQYDLQASSAKIKLKLYIAFGASLRGSATLRRLSLASRNQRVDHLQRPR